MLWFVLVILGILLASAGVALTWRKAGPSKVGTVLCLAGLLMVWLAAGCAAVDKMPRPSPVSIPIRATLSVSPEEAAKGLIEAGRLYGGAHVCESEAHPLLMSLAADHAEWMADAQRQGHQGFPRRAREIRGELGSVECAEIVAESWPDQAEALPVDLGTEMFRCWRTSSGHWDVASAKHRYFGAGMAKSNRGIWYACIVVAD